MTQQFGLRGRHEHHQMQLEDFLLERDDDGNEFLTRQGGLNVKQRLAKPKMFAAGDEERCPIKVFKLYLAKRPTEIKTSGHFTFLVIDKPVSNAWYKKTPL